MKHHKIRFTAIFICALSLFSLLLGIGTNIYAKNALDPQSFEIMDLMCDKHASNLDGLLIRIEQSVDSLSFYLLSQLESAERLSKDKNYLVEYTDRVLPGTLELAKNTDGAMSVFVRYNPNFTTTTTTTSGFYWTRDEEYRGFTQKDVTDISRVENYEYVNDYFLPIETGVSNWVSPVYKHNVDMDVISYVAPLIKDGTAIGIVGMDIDCRLLEKAAEEISIYKTGNAFLYDKNKGIHYHPSHTHDVWSEDISAEMLLELERIDYRDNEIITYEWNNEATCATFKQLKNGLYLFVTAPKAEVFSVKNNLRLGMNGALALTTIVIAVCVICIYHVGADAVEFYIERRTKYDEMTGVYTRKYFFEEARKMIDESEESCYIIRINVCNFKNINELYGDDVGDLLLMEIGYGLLGEWKKRGYIASRFTADQFYLCVKKSAYEQFSFIKSAEFPHADIEIYLNYGVFSVEDNRALSIGAMCDRANMALRSTNHSSLDYVRYYDDKIHQRKLREQEIENEMDNAIKTKQFKVFIQPKYDAETNEMVGGEALVRWLHPEKGNISPGEFIPLFETNGFIRTLDFYVWEECFAFIRKAKDKGLYTPTISINVSRSHFYGTEFRIKLMKLLDTYNLQPKDIELEITETIYGESPEIIIEECDALRRTGFSVAMDDFGSGYSSLNMLKELPLDVVKMDVRFLSGSIALTKKAENILRNLINMVKALDMKVVVEGVETKEQFKFIQKLGGCVVQGYYFARPMPTEEFLELIEKK